MLDFDAISLNAAIAEAASILVGDHIDSTAFFLGRIGERMLTVAGLDIASL